MRQKSKLKRETKKIEDKSNRSEAVDPYEVVVDPVDFKGYEEVSFLGNGAYGTVCLLRCPDTEDTVAVKSFLPNADNDVRTVEREFKTELKNFRKLGYHKHLVQFRLAFREIEQVEDELCFEEMYVSKIALEYCKEGDLSGIYENRVGTRYTEKVVRDIIMQCCHGLVHMLERGLVHRDIKPGNILVKSYDPVHVVIADLNFASPIEETTDKSGTLLYKAPETSMRRFRRHTNNKGQLITDEKADVWGLGIICYELLAGRVKPFAITSVEFHKLVNMEVSDNELGKRYERALHGHAYDQTQALELSPPEHWVNVSDEAIEVVRWMLKYESGYRASYADILESDWASKEYPEGLPSLYDHRKYKDRVNSIDEFGASCFITQ